MKKALTLKFALLSSLFIFIFSLVSCPFDIDSNTGRNAGKNTGDNLFDDSQAQIGYFAFEKNSGAMNNARAIKPDQPTIGDFPLYVLIFDAVPTGANTQKVFERDSTNLYELVPLPIGTWDLTIFAFTEGTPNDPSPTYNINSPSAQGTYTGILIEENDITTANPLAIELGLFTAGGKGDFKWTIKSDVLGAELSLARMIITLRYMTETVIDFTDTTKFPDFSTTGIVSDTTTLDAGFYDVNIQLVHTDGRKAGFYDMLYIYRDLESALNEEFKESHFTYLDGTGTGIATDPFIVRTEASLRRVGTETPLGGWTLDAHYLQVADITLTQEGGNGNIEWTRIGGNTDATGFGGSYNGGGFTISNLTMTGSGTLHGMFGYVRSSGRVRNLGLLNVDIDISGTASNSVGGIAGNNSGNIENCYVTGDVSGYAVVGGVVGCNWEGTVTDCYSTATISGISTGIGGVVGYNETGTVTKCYSTGNVVSAGSQVGGVVGGNGSSGILTKSYSTGNVTGNQAVGGVIGINDEGSTVSHCYATGNVTGTSGVGGVVGSYGDSLIEFCYSTGNIFGNNNVGGIAGNSWDAFQSCIAFNPNVKTTAGTSTNLGRVVGNSSTFTNLRARGDMDIRYGVNPADGSGGTSKDITSSLQNMDGLTINIGSSTFAQVFSGADVSADNFSSDIWIIPDGTISEGVLLPTLRGMPGAAQDPRLPASVLPPAVTVTVNSVTTGYSDLEAALDTINSSDSHVIRLYTDQSIGSQTFTGGASVFTLIGDISDGASERTITLNSNGAMFELDGTGSSLTLGANIKLVGRSNNNSALVVVNTGAFFIMEGGSVTGNTRNGNGGGVYVNGGTFTMNGGTIGGVGTAGNISYGNGGGVYIKGGTFVMTGGSIIGNAVAGGDGGGGVAIESGVFNMSGGNIGTVAIPNTTTNGGGGVYMPGGTFNMSGGFITGNTAPRGGAIYQEGGAFNMSGTAVINSNSVSGNGGGIYNSGDPFNKTGGTIYGNDATANANISGSGIGHAIHYSHWDNASSTHYYLRRNTTSGSSDNLSSDPANAAWANWLGDPITNNTEWDNAINVVNTGTFTAPRAYTFNVTGNFYAPAINGNLGEFNFSQSNIVVTLIGDGIIEEGSDCNIFCLNTGQTLIVDGPTLTSGGEVSLIYVKGGRLELKSGTLTNSTAGSNGTAVRVDNGGIFEMSGGYISNNENWGINGGGGVYIDNNGTFNMSGGTISGNTAKHAGSNGGGVYLESNANFTKTGNSIIYGNDATDPNNRNTSVGNGHAVYWARTTNPLYRNNTSAALHHMCTGCASHAGSPQGWDVGYIGPFAITFADLTDNTLDYITGPTLSISGNAPNNASQPYTAPAGYTYEWYINMVKMGTEQTFTLYASDYDAGDEFFMTLIITPTGGGMPISKAVSVTIVN